MAQILSDKEIRKLIDKAIISEADPEQVRANSYVLRMGKEVRFFSTREKKAGSLGDILVVNPGDSVLVHSIETMDFSQSTIDELYQGKQLCAFLTPSTTLVREAMQLPSTKVDPGYIGTLNWTIRNSGVEPLQMEMGEPIFKATFFLLSDNEEIPEKDYGARSERDFYQGKTGLVDSKRRLPVDIATRTKITVSSKGTELERLKQSGFPYDFLATQLQQVGDHLDIVTQDYARIDKRVESQGAALSQKVSELEEHFRSIVDKEVMDFTASVDNIVFRKVAGGGVMLLSVVLALGAGVKYLIDKGQSSLIAPIAAVLAMVGWKRRFEKGPVSPV